MDNNTFENLAKITTSGEDLLQSTINLMHNLSELDKKILIDSMHTLIRSERLDAICKYGTHMIESNRS